jgi:drug/metabolite transporter (DMT)-like permease
VTAGALLFRGTLAAVGLCAVIAKVVQYRRDRRAGLIPSNSRLLRAGRVLALAIAALSVSYVLEPTRIFEQDWPHWLVLLFLALLFAGVGCLYYAAFLFWGAKTEPGPNATSRSPNEEL